MRLNSILVGYYVNNVYLIDPSTVLFRLHHSRRPERRLVLSAPRGLWLTKYDVPRERVEGIASALRREILRAEISSITQPRGERIAEIRFESDKGVRKVVLELFGGGNMVVTDKDDRILYTLRRLRVKHRTVKVGETYILPPARGVDVTALKPGDLAPIRESDLETSRWLVRNLALSRKYVEEALTRAGIESKAEGRSLSEGDILRLYNSIRDVVDMVVKGDVEPTVVYRDGEPMDAAPFRLEAYRGFECRRFESFIEALDEVFTSEIRAEKTMSTLKPLLKKAEEIRRSIERQSEAEEEAVRAAKALKEYAERLRETVFKDPSLQPSKELLSQLGAKDVASMKGRLIILIHGVRIEAEASWSPMKIASQIFDEAKRLERKAEAIRAAQRDLKARLEGLEEGLKAEETAKAEMPTVKREKAWYERYRWFKTSEGLLAVGGRDASTNSVIIRRHTDEGDVVFHADLHGSPFFTLKGYDESKKRSLEETAQAVVAFSSAWRDELSSADAYWVRPEQVKRQAPSGMYLPRGAFLIQGVKNYVKNLRVECAVGLARIDGELTVISGPLEAVRRNSVAYVVLVPDRGKPSDTAKMVRAELAEMIRDEAGFVRRISVDEFLRAMPPGAGRIVLKGFGEQRY